MSSGKLTKPCQYRQPSLGPGVDCLKPPLRRPLDKPIDRSLGRPYVRHFQPGVNATCVHSVRLLFSPVVEPAT